MYLVLISFPAILFSLIKRKSPKKKRRHERRQKLQMNQGGRERKKRERAKSKGRTEDAVDETTTSSKRVQTESVCLRALLTG